MDRFNCLKNNFSQRIVAGFLVVLLLLAAISPVFNQVLLSKINSTDITLSSPASSSDFGVGSSQPRVDYFLYQSYQSKLSSDYTCTKRNPVDDTPAIYHNYENSNNLPRLLGPAPVLPTSLNKDIKFFYLSTDIPPPFSVF
jgi:hypothetical protein